MDKLAMTESLFKVVADNGEIIRGLILIYEVLGQDEIAGRVEYL